MSVTPLSTSEEVIERSIYERIRLELVAKGYTPDITTLLNNDAADMSTYKAALTSIAASPLGFSIELFGAGSPQKAGDKHVPRIVIESGNFLEGELGGDQTRAYQLNDAGDGYNTVIRPSMTSELSINIHIVAQTTQQIRILQAIVSLALQVRGYLPVYTQVPNEIQPTANLFYKRNGYADLPNTEEGVMERVWKFTIYDVYEIECIAGDDVAMVDSVAFSSQGNGPINVTTPAGSFDITVNGSVFKTINGNYNIPVKDATGASVGVIDVTDPANPIWVVPANVLDSYNITINGSTFSTINANTDIPVKYANGTTVGSKVSNEWIIPNPPTISSLVLEIAQNISYVPFDDGSRFLAGDYAGINISPIVDPYTLVNVNEWGHTKRFTGDTGGYMDETTGLFYDVTGVLTTKSLAFPNDIMRCYMSRRRIYLLRSGARTWPNAVSLAHSETRGGETGWFLPSDTEYGIFTIGHSSNPTYLDSRLFNFSSFSMWCSGTTKNNSLQALTVETASNAHTARTKTTTAGAGAYIKIF